MKRRPVADGALEARLGHVFADRALIERALTHITAARTKLGRLGSYQRLEFLGDRVLGLAVSDMLIAAFPKADEGELSRRLADLVRAEACAEVAEAMDLSAYIRLGPGEASSGGRRKTAILADVCEAVVGAAFLDGGWPAARALVERFWGERMLAAAKATRDPKTALQEWTQGKGMPSPLYQEIARTGPDHDLFFRILVTVPGIGEAEGAGRSKRAAEQAAAEALISQEGLAAHG